LAYGRIGPTEVRVILILANTGLALHRGGPWLPAAVRARQLGLGVNHGGDAGAAGRALRAQSGNAQEDGAAAQAEPERPPILKDGLG